LRKMGFGRAPRNDEIAARLAGGRAGFEVAAGDRDWIPADCDLGTDLPPAFSRLGRKSSEIGSGILCPGDFDTSPTGGER
jgi:hypothetical protein